MSASKNKRGAAFPSFFFFFFFYPVLGASPELVVEVGSRARTSLCLQSWSEAESCDFGMDVTVCGHLEMYSRAIYSFLSIAAEFSPAKPRWYLETSLSYVSVI